VACGGREAGDIGAMILFRASERVSTDVAFLADHR
jgi:hypothetical protein